MTTMEKARKTLWTITSVLFIAALGIAVTATFKMENGFPLHFDLEGNYATMKPISFVMLYPAAIGLISAFCKLLEGLTSKSGFMQKKPLRALWFSQTAIILTIFVTFSMMVGITWGKVHFFMFAEPFLLLLLIGLVIFGEFKKK